VEASNVTDEMACRMMTIHIFSLSLFFHIIICLFSSPLFSKKEKNKLIVRVCMCIMSTEKKYTSTKTENGKKMEEMIALNILLGVL
jgi:hypothetical protein